MLSVIMLNDVMLSVVMQNVVAPFFELLRLRMHGSKQWLHQLILLQSQIVYHTKSTIKFYKTVSFVSYIFTKPSRFYFT
jgi:hypothetical protein